MRNFFGRLFQKRNKQLTLKDASREMQELFGAVPGPAGVSVTPEKVLGITAFWNGVRIISQTIAGLPFEVYERTSIGRRLAREHPVYKLLHVRPNPYMTPYTFKEIRSAHVLTWGNSYAEIERDGAGRPIALWPLLPDRTGVEVKNGEKVYWTIVGGAKVYLAADRVLHVPGLGFDGLRGYNVIKLFRDSLGLTLAANEYGAQFFGNSGRPSGILVHPSKLTVEEQKRIREEWNQLHTGLTRAQRTAVLFGGMEFKAIRIPPEEAQFLETRSLQIDEVARILNINPILLQKTEGATTWGTAIGQFLVAFGKFTIAPWLEREEDAVNWDLFSESERSRFYAKYNMAALLRGDAKTQAEILEIERRNAIINADEWRELTDRNPLPDGQGKLYFMPLNMAPVDHMLERDPENLPAPQRSIRSADRMAKEERGLAIRDKLREAHRPAFEDGARRFVRPEVQALRRAIKRALQDGDPARSINDWIEEYYPDHRQRIYRVMRPLVYALAAMIAEAAFDEVGADPLDVTEWVEAYTDNLARREVAISISEIRKVMGETKLEELGEVLTAKSEQWEENRPGRVANRELVRVASGAARWAWQTAGIAALVWKANADACPICKELDGKRIPTRSYFLTEGDAVGSGTNTLVVGEPIGGPPLHEGCICDIVPG